MSDSARPVSNSGDPVARAYIEACLAELDAPKPGNVHRFAPGHRMEVADFVLSAEASAPWVAAGGARVGTRVRGAVEATLAAVGQNTNLGIVLLCAPLAAAAEAPPDAALRPALARVLDDLDRADARRCFRRHRRRQSRRPRPRGAARREGARAGHSARGDGGGGGAGPHRAAVRHEL